MPVLFHGRSRADAPSMAQGFGGAAMKQSRLRSSIFRILPVISVVAVFVAWYFVSAHGPISQSLFPGPLTVAEEAAKYPLSQLSIDIRTSKGAEVYAIFEGKVAGTQFIPGYKHTVIIQHGNYYSVYSNLEQIFVKRNDLIKNGQSVGKVGTKSPDLHFEIWQEKTRQNPVNWIRK